MKKKECEHMNRVRKILNEYEEKNHIVFRDQKEAMKLIEFVVEKIIKLSDEMEQERETTFEEWRAFKGFRNTLRDNFKKYEKQYEPKTHN